ncbi:MAG: hypothetical protein E7453_03540 [Ruminococcaceae bacterium]|nr:hypothetical protein [Oscillospiraceae bacterium]
MKILHCADLHLDAPLQGYEELKEKVLTIPGKLLDICRREECELVLIAGDIFHGPYTRQSFRILRSALEEMAVPVFITPGNHDFLSSESPYIKEIWPDNVHIFKNPQMEKYVLPGVTIWGAGYTAMDCPGLLAGFTAEGEGLQIGLLHADITPNAPCCPITKKQIAGSGLSYLALGHIHKGDIFTAGDTLCAYPGCAYGRHFGENEEKGVLIYDTEEKSHRFIPLGLPAFYEYTAPVVTTAADAISHCLPAAGDENYYRITLTGHSKHPDLPALREAFSQFPRLTLRDETLPPLDIWQGVGSDSFSGQYFSLLKENMDAAPEADKSLFALAAKLSRQILDGEEVILP